MSHTTPPNLPRSEARAYAAAAAVQADMLARLGVRSVPTEAVELRGHLIPSEPVPEYIDRAALLADDRAWRAMRRSQR